VIVDESAGLILLIAEQPVSNFKNHVRELLFASDLPPFTERLEQPRDLSEVSLVAKAMAVVLEAAAQFSILPPSLSLQASLRASHMAAASV